jgi:pyruvate/2-oxoglutarate/acetoin dehydrogenase E1 component
MQNAKVSYGEAICHGFRYLLREHPEVFVIGQGLWSPWYVGNSMTGLDKEFGVERVIDTPVSEASCTGIAIGASLCGYRAVAIHPRMDFMILAMDQIVNQAAKWSHMLGGKAHPAVTIRSIINRGGEQGAQHSQALQSWFAHIPGLRVVMPYSAQDARDLLVASVLCDDPVLYIDDRWLYESDCELPAIPDLTPLAQIGPKRIRTGSQVTLVGSSYSTRLCVEAADALAKQNIEADVIDLRVINPLNYDLILESVQKTGRLCVVDGGWANCGLAGEIIAGVIERLPSPASLKAKPARITLPAAPAPTSKPLEQIYYPKASDVVNAVLPMLNR